jgi:dipeptidyl aminopeptidase/acylaminoacyl peptidase
MIGKKSFPILLALTAVVAQSDPPRVSRIVVPRIVALFAAVKSPDDRTITDPKSLNSRSNPNAGPIEIDELFYTRNVSGPAWSPEGREVVFSTNLSGRMNLWKVTADGGWPIQLSQSDDRQSLPAWSRDGKWIVYQQDYAGGNYHDLFAIPKGGECGESHEHEGCSRNESPLVTRWRHHRLPAQAEDFRRRRPRLDGLVHSCGPASDSRTSRGSLLAADYLVA